MAGRASPVILANPGRGAFCTTWEKKEQCHLGTAVLTFVDLQVESLQVDLETVSTAPALTRALADWGHPPTFSLLAGILSEAKKRCSETGSGGGLQGSSVRATVPEAQGCSAWGVPAGTSWRKCKWLLWVWGCMETGRYAPQVMRASLCPVLTRKTLNPARGPKGPALAAAHSGNTSGRPCHVDRCCSPTTSPSEFPVSSPL